MAYWGEKISAGDVHMVSGATIIAAILMWSRPTESLRAARTGHDLPVSRVHVLEPSLVAKKTASSGLQVAIRWSWLVQDREGTMRLITNKEK